MGFNSSFIRGGVLVAVALIHIPTAKSALIIDAFDDFQQVKVQPSPGVNTVTSNVNGSGVLGNNREFFLERDPNATSAGPNNGTLVSDDGGSKTLQLITGPGQKTRATITYDGSGVGDVDTDTFQGSPNTFYLDEAIGAALANFENNGYAFRLDILSDQSLPLTIRVWDSTGANFVSRTFTIPVGTESVVIPFSTFVGTTAPENVFNQVGALTLSLGTPGPAPFGSAAGTGAEISFFAVIDTPEPGTMAIAGFALVGLASYGRKRRAA